MLYPLSTPVAVKETGPLLRGTVALSVFEPSGIVQLPTAAIPSLPVVATPPVMLPPPLVTANVTCSPASGWPLPSVTFTAGGILSA